MSCDIANGGTRIFGVNLRTRVSSIMKLDASANGVLDQRIDTHSLRAGGATALYTQGVPLDAIQRRGRWKSLTFHQYLRHGASALNHLSEAVVRSHGLLGCLELTNKPVKKTRFQPSPPTTTSGGENLRRTPSRWTHPCFYRMAAFAPEVSSLGNQRARLSHRLICRPVLPHLTTSCTEHESSLSAKNERNWRRTKKSTRVI